MSLWRSAVWRSVFLIVLPPFVLALTGVMVVQNQLEQHLLAEAESRLTAELRSFETLYEQRRVIAVRQAMEFRGLRHSDESGVYLLEDREGNWLGGNLQSWPISVERQTGGFEATRFQTVLLSSADKVARPYLVASVTLRGGFPMLIGQNLTPMQETLSRMGKVFAVFGAFMLCSGLAAAAIVATRARRRLNHFNRFLSRIGRDDGAERMPESDIVEYAELSDHVNAMLDRIEHLIAAHRRLGNSVAHELRTPLARLQTRLNDLNAAPKEKERLDDEIRSLIRLFDSLLSIAELDAQSGDTSGLTPVNLSSICEGIVDLYEPVAEESGRGLKAVIAPDMIVVGDQSLLSQLLSNLVENGLKYTRQGDTICIFLKPSGKRVVLRVEDDGPGVDPEQFDEVFVPFARGDQTNPVPGHGLGLALVRAIALRHGAKLTLPNVEKGFALEINCLQFNGTKERD